MNKPDNLDKELIKIFGEETPESVADDAMCRFGVKIGRRKSMLKIIVWAINKWDSLEPYEKKKVGEQ